MFHLSLSPSMSKPPRSPVVLNHSQSQLASIQDELHDIKRVHTQGQEEDLRMALGRAITRIEDLSTMMMEHYTVQKDIQTELTLCKSNLQLALANNEMLEDALKRDTSGRGKDLGWRRQQQSPLGEQRSSESFEVDRQPIDPPPATSDNSGVIQDGGFFRFRFGGGNGSGRATPQPSQTVPNGVHRTNLSSASLSSLVPSKEKEYEELTLELERERKAHSDIVVEKKKLEEELESLSQALFEEANKMVAAERMKLADVEAELQQIRDEKEALRSALRLIEDESYKFLSENTLPSRSHSRLRAHTVPRATSSSPSDPSQPSSPMRPPQSISSVQQQPTLSSSSSRSTSPDPAFVTPNLVPLDYGSRELSPWTEVSGTQSSLDIPSWSEEVSPLSPSALTPTWNTPYPQQQSVSFSAPGLPTPDTISPSLPLPTTVSSSQPRDGPLSSAPEDNITRL